MYVAFYCKQRGNKKTQNSIQIELYNVLYQYANEKDLFQAIKSNGLLSNRSHYHTIYSCKGNNHLQDNLLDVILSQKSEIDNLEIY